MKTKNSIRALSGAIAISMVAVIPVSADEPIKDETVFVNLDSDDQGSSIKYRVYTCIQIKH
ncbi:hypothetical protein [Erysipelothrix piscisicarius]|uniref:hypothetical protein n=1 Tax=Erysipelothrix piscisicarius TaxID=2485784 RepID=UPI002F93647F